MPAKAGLEDLRAVLAISAAWSERGMPNLLNVGAMGESIVAAMHPDWQRMPAGTAAFDFIDTTGRRVQVKTWGTLQRDKDKVRRDADRLIVLRLHATGWDLLCDRLLAPLWNGTDRQTLIVTRSMHVVEDIGANAPGGRADRHDSIAEFSARAKRAAQAYYSRPDYSIEGQRAVARRAHETLRQRREALAA
jgi:hypothetical protein